MTRVAQLKKRFATAGSGKKYIAIIHHQNNPGFGVISTGFALLSPEEFNEKFIKTGLIRKGPNRMIEYTREISRVKMYFRQLNEGGYAYMTEHQYYGDPMMSDECSNCGDNWGCDCEEGTPRRRVNTILIKNPVIVDIYHFYSY